MYSILEFWMNLYTYYFPAVTFFICFYNTFSQIYELLCIRASFAIRDVVTAVVSFRRFHREVPPGSTRFHARVYRGRKKASVVTVSKPTVAPYVVGSTSVVFWWRSSLDDSHVDTAPPSVVVRRTIHSERRISNIRSRTRLSSEDGRGEATTEHACAADWQTIREGSSTRRHHGRHTRKGRDSGPVSVIDRRPTSRRGCIALLLQRETFNFHWMSLSN